MARTSPYQINDHDELDHVPEPPRPYHAVTPPNARGVYLRVVISYATAHGAVTSLLDVASSAMSDPTLGADASALFYLCYSLSGLLLAVPIIDHFGVKVAFLGGFGLTSLQVVGMLLAVTRFKRSPALCLYVSYVLGGFGDGLILTAEGTYLSRCAAHIARQKRTPLAQQTTSLAALLACVALPTEALLLLLSSAALELGAAEDGYDTMFALLSVIVVVGLAIGIATIQPIDEPPPEDGETAAGEAKGDGGGKVAVLRGGARARGAVTLAACAHVVGLASRALLLAYHHPVSLALLSPVIAARAWVETTVDKFVDEEVTYMWVSLTWAPMFLQFEASVVAALFVAAILFSSTVKRWLRDLPAARGGLTALGMAGYALAALLTLVCTFGRRVAVSKSVAWVALVPLYAGKGLGRGAFESIFKASLADHFPGQGPEAFSNYMIQRGVYTAIVFWLLPRLETGGVWGDGLWTIGVCGVALSVVAAPLYLKADLMHQRRQEAMAPLPLGE